MIRELGFAIIGCGNIGPFHARAIKEIKGARLVIVSDAIEKNAKKMGEEFGVKWTMKLNEVLSLPEVEAIDNNREPLVNGEEGRKAVEIILAIDEFSCPDFSLVVYFPNVAL